MCVRVCMCVCMGVGVCCVCVYLESMARAESRGSISRDVISGVSISEQNIRKLQMAAGDIDKSQYMSESERVSELMIQ